MAAIVLNQHPYKTSAATLETLFFLMNFGLCLTFDLASWLFVGNYWNFATRLKLITTEQNPFEKERIVKVTVGLVSFLVLVICLFYLWSNLYYIHKGGPKSLTVLSLVLENLAQANCCVFLGISLYTIYSSIQNSKYRRIYQVDVKIIAWHASAYLIQLLVAMCSLTAFYVSQEKFVKMQIFFVLMSTTSQFIFISIINSMYK